MAVKATQQLTTRQKWLALVTKGGRYIDNTIMESLYISAIQVIDQIIDIKYLNF